MKLLTLFIATLAIATNSWAQAPFHTPDNIGAGNCLSLDGTNDYIGNIGTTSNYSFVQNTGVFPVEAWILLDDLTSTGDQMIIGNSPSSASKGFNFWFQNTGTVTRLRTVLYRGALGTYVIRSNSPSDIINDNDWHHVATVGDGSNITFYLDGVNLAGTDVMVNFPSGNSTNDMRIGHAHWAPGGYFDGKIDEFRIWNTARTQTQIRDNMCRQLTGSETGLVGYWPMNEGEDNTCSGGQDVCDQSGNGNHGTLEP